MIDGKPAWSWVKIPIVGVRDDGTAGVTGTERLRRHRCAVGEYPWDHWRTRAQAAGVPEDLAQLGRAVMREADQHVWSDELQDECGWTDDGVAMLARALRDPAATRRRWQSLLDTDGAR